MSNRSIRKRRHRPDFANYMAERKVLKAAGGPLWKRAGFPSFEQFNKYLATKPQAEPAEHVHGPNCGHSGALPPVVPHTHPEGWSPLDNKTDHVHDPNCNHSHEEMSDEEWLDAPLTPEEKAAFEAADGEEGEPF